MMSKYERKLRKHLKGDNVTEIIMKAAVLSKALKEAFPRWAEDEKMKKFVTELDEDPEGLMQMRDEEGIFLK